MFTYYYGGGLYRNDYDELLVKTSSIYHVTDSWENYGKMSTRQKCVFRIGKTCRRLGLLCTALISTAFLLAPFILNSQNLIKIHFLWDKVQNSCYSTPNHRHGKFSLPLPGTFPSLFGGKKYKEDMTALIFSRQGFD